MKWIAGYIAAVCLLLIIVAQSIFIPTFHIMPYFSWHYQQRNIPEVIGIEHDELMIVTAELLDYMRGRRDDLAIYATFADGEVRQFFTDPVEIIHMVDVLDLYDMAFMIRNISFWLLLLLIFVMAFFNVRILEVLARCSREVVVLFLILLALLGAVIAWDFDAAFVVFHQIFFNNNYWILDPSTSLLLNMVPQVFFVEISIIVGALLLIFSIAVIVASTVYLRMFGPRNDTRIVARFR